MIILGNINLSFSRKIILTLSLVLLIGIILEIWVVNRLSTYGEKISKLEKAAAILKLENQVLKNKVDLKSSIQEIEIRAKEAGFVKINKLQYLLPLDIALNSPQ